MRFNFKILKAQFFIGLLVLFAHQLAFADHIVISGRKVIDKSIRYKNSVLDLSHGQFQIVNNATLEIENCKVHGTISPNNKNLIIVEKGSLILKNNKFKVKTNDIPQTKSSPSSYYVISISQGQAEVVGNRFSTEQPFTVGLFVTYAFPTTDHTILANHIKNFHGGFVLKNTHHTTVANNRFSTVSISNILMLESSDNTIEKNEILFPGNNNVGDGIDILDSENIKISKNYIGSASCYSIYVLRGKDIFLEGNTVRGGITYALSIQVMIGTKDDRIAYLADFVNDHKRSNNQNITVINNYFTQNRYGLTAANVDGLSVRNNIFIQKFSNETTRRFWTNNDILLHNIDHINWENNLYKEAYAQDDTGRKSFQFVEFPALGGVNL